MKQENGKGADFFAQLLGKIKAAMSRRGVRRGVIAGGCVVVALLAVIIGYSIWETPPEQKGGEDSVDNPTNEQAPEATNDLDDFEGALKTAHNDGIYTFLLVGNDDGTGNTDTIMVGSLDTNEHSVNVVSIPRDTMCNISWSTKRINSVYWGTVNGGGVGIDGLKTQITNMVGFEPDCYVLIDIAAFVEIVDAVGGIEFDVPIDMDYDDPAQNLSVHLRAGKQTLTGEQAIGLVRFRQDNYGGGYGDIGRIETQQKFLKAAASQMLSLGNVPNIGKITSIITENLDTDLSAANISFFVRQLLKCKAEDINFYTAPTSGAFIGGVSYQSLIVDEWIKMLNEHLNPTNQTITTANVNLLTSNGTAFFSTSGEYAGGYGSFANFSNQSAASAGEPSYVSEPSEGEATAEIHEEGEGETEPPEEGEVIIEIHEDGEDILGQGPVDIGGKGEIIMPTPSPSPSQPGQTVIVDLPPPQSETEG